MAWRSVDVEELRIRFVVLSSRSGRSHSELCREFGISRPTGYLWLKRYGRGGVRAVAEISHRPHSSPRARRLARLPESDGHWMPRGGRPMEG
jgi:transposase-like protein